MEDVLGTLVRLSEADRPSGIQAEVLRAVQNMVVLLDEQFLVHSAVHKAVLRLLRNCVGDDLQEQMDNRSRKVMGAAGNTVRSLPSEYEEDCEHNTFSRSHHTDESHSGKSLVHPLQPHPNIQRIAHDILPRQALVSLRTTIFGRRGGG